ALGVVREPHRLVRRDRVGLWEGGQNHPGGRYLAAAAGLSPPPAAAGSEGCSSVIFVSSSVVSPPIGTMLSTPWPLRRTSMSSSPVWAMTEVEPEMTRLAVDTSSPRFSRT